MRSRKTKNSTDIAKKIQNLKSLFKSILVNVASPTMHKAQTDSGQTMTLQQIFFNFLKTHRKRTPIIAHSTIFSPVFSMD